MGQYASHLIADPINLGNLSPLPYKNEGQWIKMRNKRSKLTQSSVIDWHRCQNACVLPLCWIELWNLSNERWHWWKRRTCLINLCQIKVSSSTQVTQPPHSFLWFCFLVGLYKWQELIKLMSIYLFLFFFLFLQHTPGISMHHSLSGTQGTLGFATVGFKLPHIVGEQ